MRPQMNTDTIKGDWNEIKGKIKHRFGKLTDDSIESMNGNLDMLAGKLQSTYGYAKEEAEKEFESFKATIHNAADAVSKATAAPAAATAKVLTGDPVKSPSDKPTLVS